MDDRLSVFLIVYLLAGLGYSMLESEDSHEQFLRIVRSWLRILLWPVLIFVRRTKKDSEA
jgi:predicted permease